MTDLKEGGEPLQYPIHWGGYDGAASAYPEQYSKWLNEQKDKAVDILKNANPQGFEEYDSRDFVPAPPDPEPKYEIIYDEMSCYNWGFSINGVWRSGERNEGVKSPEEDDELLDYLLVKLKEHIKIGYVSFKDLVECFQSEDTEFDDSSCDDCGHSGYKTTWKI